jgi:hypothetical protein
MPGNLSLFVEHKNIAGMKLRATVRNLLDMNEAFGRTIFVNRRTGPARFTESRDRYFGPVLALELTGAL